MWCHSNHACALNFIDTLTIVLNSSFDTECNKSSQELARVYLIQCRRRHSASKYVETYRTLGIAQRKTVSIGIEVSVPRPPKGPLGIASRLLWSRLKNVEEAAETSVWGSTLTYWYTISLRGPKRRPFSVKIMAKRADSWWIKNTSKKYRYNERRNIVIKDCLA